MKFNKKGALSDELILFLFATFILMVLMIGLHLIVVSTTSSEDEDSAIGKYRTQNIDIGGYFFVEDFLNYNLNSSQKQKYSKLIDKNLSENVSVEHLLTSPNKDLAEDFFHEIKDVYLDENGEKLNDFFNFAGLGEDRKVDSPDDYIVYMHFNYENIDDRREILSSCNYFSNFFRSDSSKVLPIRSKSIDEEVILFSVEPIFTNCLNMLNDEEEYIR